MLTNIRPTRKEYVGDARRELSLAAGREGTLESRQGQKVAASIHDRDCGSIIGDKKLKERQNNFARRTGTIYTRRQNTKLSDDLEISYKIPLGHEWRLQKRHAILRRRCQPLLNTECTIIMSSPYSKGVIITTNPFSIMTFYCCAH